jgi:hypothetical protein
MRPLTIFDSHFRAARTLLTVYRLLEADESRPDAAGVTDALRGAAQCEADESVIVLLNDMFLGLVRERAEVPPFFFKQANLSLLLRQAVVSSCTALDVFFPALLNEHLASVVEIRRRNFLPKAGEVRKLFEGFRLKLEDLPALLEEEAPSERWAILTRRVLDHLRDKVLSNVEAISAVMLLLGIDDPWKQIAGRAGVAEQSLSNQIRTLVKRRNDIVHRGDRPVTDPTGPAQAIDLAWTSSHVNAVQAVFYDWYCVV